MKRSIKIDLGTPRLTLEYERMEDVILEKAAQRSCRVSSLQYLNLSHNFISDNGAAQLCKLDLLLLSELDLSNNPFTTMSCKFISASLFCSLKDLKMNRCGVEDIGVSHLAKARWGKLQQISLQNNRINGESLLFLSRSNWKSLHYLNLFGNKMKIDCLRAFIVEVNAMKKGVFVRFNILKLNIQSELTPLRKTIDELRCKS